MCARNASVLGSLAVRLSPPDACVETEVDVVRVEEPVGEVALEHDEHIIEDAQSVWTLRSSM